MRPLVIMKNIMRWIRFDAPKTRRLVSFKRQLSVGAIVVCGMIVTIMSFATPLTAFVSAQSTPKVISSRNIRFNEAAGTAEFTLTISDSSFDGTVTVNYFTSDQTTTASQDYMGISKGSISFPYNQGPASVTVQVRIIDDTLVESPEETFSLNISSPQQGQQGVTLAQNSYIATIIDNDVAPTPPTTTTPTPPVRPRPTIPTPTPTPEPIPEPTPEPEPAISTVPEVLSSTTPPPSITDPPRSEFVKSVPTPQDLQFTAERVIRTILIAALLVLLIMFPADLFNSTLQSNYDEIIGWFKMDYIGKLHRKMQLHKIPIAIVLTVFAGLVTLLNAQLSPDFGLNRASAALLLGMFTALTFAATVYDLSRALYLKKRFGLRGKLRAHALGLGVGALFVTISRLANFVPGYLYGLFTGLIFKQKGPTSKQDGEGLALSSVLILVLAIAGWFALIPVRSVSTQPDASFIALVAEAALATLWVSALGMIVFSLVPMRFIYGEQVKKWNKYAWAAIYGCGMLLFVYTLLDPNQSVYGKSATASWLSVLSLFIGFGVFSLSFWAYFRFRPTRPQPKKQAA